MSQQKTKTYELMVKVNDLIMQERYRQNELWGLQRHSPGKWLGILGEEFGEACQAVNRIHFPKDAKPTDAMNLTTELIQVAAVAQAWAEQLVEEMQQAEAEEFKSLGIKSLIPCNHEFRGVSYGTGPLKECRLCGHLEEF